MVYIDPRLFAFIQHIQQNNSPLIGCVAVYTHARRTNKKCDPYSNQSRPDIGSVRIFSRYIRYLILSCIKQCQNSKCRCKCHGKSIHAAVGITGKPYHQKSGEPLASIIKYHTETVIKNICQC